MPGTDPLRAVMARSSRRTRTSPTTAQHRFRKLPVSPVPPRQLVEIDRPRPGAGPRMPGALPRRSRPQCRHRSRRGRFPRLDCRASWRRPRRGAAAPRRPRRSGTRRDPPSDCRSARQKSAPAQDDCDASDDEHLRQRMPHVVQFGDRELDLRGHPPTRRLQPHDLPNLGGRYRGNGGPRRRPPPTSARRSADSWQETVYLLRSPENARRLMQAVARDKAGRSAVTKSVDELREMAGGSPA